MIAYLIVEMKSELETLMRILNEISIPFQLLIATQELKIVFNLPPMDRYEADQVIKLAGSVLFFDHTGKFMGIGSIYDQNSEKMIIGRYEKRK